MADEKKKEPVKYKFGEQEFDLERYIKNIDANAASYMEKLNWNEGQKQEFMSAYNLLLGGLKDLLANNTNRFSTNSFGSILDSQGLLSNTDNDNIDPVGSEYYYDDKGNKITTDDYNTLKKRKQKNYLTFSANRAVATYFNKVGRSLLEKMKLEEKPVATTDDNSFNFGKHGFVKWWRDKYNPGGGTLDGTAILELDLLVDGKRARTKRSARLALDFTDYMGGLSDDLDFSKTRFKDKAGYTKFLNGIITKINDGAGLEENDLLDLSQAGVGRDFLEPFLSTNKTVTVSDADRAAEEAKKKADAEALQKKEREDAMRKYIEEQQALSALSIGESYSDNNWFTVGIPYNEKWYNYDGTFDSDKFLDTLPKDTNMASMIESFANDPYNSKWGNQRYALLKYIVDSGKAQPINNNSALQGFYYIPRATDRARATALVYNPSTQQMFETFIGNTHLWDNIMADFKRNQGWVDAASPYMRKEGGVLYAQQGASLGLDVANYIGSLSRQNLEERAKKEGRTAGLLKASERYINGEGDILPGDNSSMANPDAGFTSIEWARLAAGGADIVSALSAWAPGAGTTVSLGAGLGSTVANLYADIADDSVSAWDTTKNAALNLGMDLVGLVPGGGAAGKFAKIGKNLVKVAPKVLALIGTAGHALNTPLYINSWSKLGTDEKLDAQDWNNILSSIQAILGPAAGIGLYAKNKGYYGKNKAEAAKRADTGTVNQDKVAVKMLDNTGKEKTVLFDGDDAVAIRKAQESGKLEDLKAATVDKFQDLDGWSLKETDFGFRRPQMSLNPTKWSPVGGKTVTPDDLIADVVTRQGVDFARVRGFHDDITSFHTPGRRWEDIDNAYIEAQLLPLKAKSDKYDKVLGRKAQRVAEYDIKIAQADTNLANAKASGSNKTSAELDIKLQQMRRDKSSGLHKTKQDAITNSTTNIANHLAEVTRLDAEIDNLKKLELSEDAAGRSTEAIRRQLNDATEERNNTLAKITAEQKIIDDNTKWLADNDDSRVKALEEEYKNIKALEDAAEALKAGKAKWNVMSDTGKTKLREDFETNYPVDADGNITVQDPSTGRKITRNFKLLLDKYGIKHKKGGVLKAKWGDLFPELPLVIPGQTKEEPITLPYRPGYTPEVNTETPVSRKNSLAAMNRNGEKNWLAVDNSYENARDINKWDNYYNNDAIFKNLESHMSTLDASKFIAAANTLNGMNSDFSTKELNKKGYLAWNTEYDKTGLNKYFGSDSSKFDYLGPSTWNRNLLLKQIQEKYGTDGLTMKDGVKVYFDGKQWAVKNPEPVVQESEVTPEAVVPADDKKGTQIDTLKNGQNGNLKEEKSSWYKDFLEKATNDTFLKYSIPRAWYADRMNRKITDMAIANERPFLQDPFQVHRNVMSDLDAEAWGQRAAAQMNNLTSNMQTSDFNAYQAARLEGATKGLDYIILGNEKSNQAMKASLELAWQQEKENTKSRHDVAQLNRLAMLQTMANKGKYEQAYQTKKHEIYDTLWKEKQYKEEEEIKKNEAYADAFTKSEISDYVTSNLATLAPGLSEEGIKLYQQVKKGLVTPSSLSSDAAKYLLFMEVADAASKLEQEEFKKYKGIPDSKWSKVRSIATGKTEDDGIAIAKEGTKLKILNSRVRTKNADRFAKQLKSDLDRNDKALARLSKSIYSYIKGLMV